MSKTLSNILTIFKVVRIIAKVVFILCIIGGAGCLLGLLTLPLAESVLSSEMFLDEELSIAYAYIACMTGIIACIGEAVFAFLAERYFKHVINAGTPFTFDSAKESFRLGITSIIISVVTSIVSGIAAGMILLISSPNAEELDFSSSTSISVGLFFLFLSLIFKHGAEIYKFYTDAPKQEEQASNFESQQ